MNPGERGDSEDQNKPERTNSQPIPESITDRLVRLSSAADAGLEAVATYVDSALPDVYATKSLAEEELLQHSDDDSYTFLDSAPHLHDDYQVRCPTRRRRVATFAVCKRFASKRNWSPEGDNCYLVEEGHY